VTFRSIVILQIIMVYPSTTLSDRHSLSSSFETVSRRQILAT
jgi:hypothetical protein